jgi:hypothetical protein
LTIAYLYTNLYIALISVNGTTHKVSGLKAKQAGGSAVHVTETGYLQPISVSLTGAVVCVCASIEDYWLKTSLHIIYDMIYIFYRSWVDTRWQQYITHSVDTRWQQYITHLHTNSTHNTAVHHTFTHKQYTQYSSTSHIYTQTVRIIQR